MARLRILTANLLYDRADPDSLGELIDSVDPDVLALQELGQRGASVVRERLTHGQLGPNPDSLGLGIATRLPSTVVQLDMPGRAGFSATLDPTDWPELPQAVDIVGIHLANPIDPPWRKTSEIRQGQVAAVADHVAGHDRPTAIVGDMNSTPVWREYKSLARLGVDAARAAGTAKRTWAQFTWGPRLLRIDHAFVRGLEPVTTSVHKVAGSDHLAVLTEVDVPAV